MEPETHQTTAGDLPIWKSVAIIAALLGGLALLIVGFVFGGKWALTSWLSAGQSVPPSLRTAAYVGGLLMSLAAAFGLPPLRRRLIDGLQPEWLSGYAGIAAYLFTIITAMGAFVFALANIVPGGGPWTVITAFLALGVGTVAFLKSIKG